MSADEPVTDRELLLAIHSDVRELVKCKDDHESRLRKLEGFYAYVLGAAAVIAFSIPLAWDRVKNMFGSS